jgi:hypothetical protein
MAATENNEEAEEPTLVIADETSSGPIALHLGTPLTESQALTLSLDRPVCLIVLAGAVDCGKTTAVTTLYELFQSGPVDGVTFAGCETLPGFEQRCHLSRAVSGRETPETSRTPYEGPNAEYLHLRLQVGSAKGTIDLLLTDVSGEMLEHARNSTEECKRLTFLQRASQVLVFLDCEKGIQPGAKWAMVQDAKSLLQSCLDASMLRVECPVTVVWSKYDFFEASPHKEQCTSFREVVEKDFRDAFGQRVPTLAFKTAAARPNEFPDLKSGFGIRELLHQWTDFREAREPMVLHQTVGQSSPREIDRFESRHTVDPVRNEE